MSGMLKNALMLIATIAVGFFLYDAYQGQPLPVPDWVARFSTRNEQSAANNMRSDLRALYSQVSSPLDKGEPISDQQINAWLDICESGYLNGTYTRETATAGWHLCRNLLRLNAERRVHLREKERLTSTGLRIMARPNNEDKFVNDSAHFVRQTDSSWEQYVDQTRPRCESYLDELD